MNILLLIPIFEPSEKTIRFFEALLPATTGQILIVDDGSGEDYRDTFQQICQKSDRIHYETYPQNQGKGYALKYGLQKASEDFPHVQGIVTADGDGQHHPQDIQRLIHALSTHTSQELLLGVRSFEKKTTPAKSYWGNRLTSGFFWLATGLRLQDTQTGLRAFHTALIPSLITVKGQRFDYEMNVLLATKQLEINLISIPIQTIYEDNNAHSHFRPVHDSLLIYGPLLRFIGASLVSALLDSSFFLLLTLILGRTSLPLLAATILARLASGLINYLLNRHYVFHQKRNPTAAFRYACLFLTIIVFSWIGVNILAQVLPSLFLSKLIVDGLLFFFSFHVQQRYIFTKEATK